MKAIKEAIELLKFFKDRKNTKITTMIKVQSCIAELEALQQPKSCDDCRSKSCSIKRILLELGEINSSYFYCNDYEPKEQ